MKTVLRPPSHPPATHEDRATALPNVRVHLAPLDGLRGIAVLAVMAFHLSMFSGVAGRTTADGAWQAVASIGWTGVGLFFVLSGFLITGILYDSKEAPGYFRTFYARRILRIFPLYYGVLVAYFILLPALFPTSAAVRDHTSGQLWYWVHLSNAQIALHGWDATSPYITHFWSLAVEEQFYLVWPVVVFLMGGRQLVRFCAGIMVFSLLLRIYLFNTGAGVAAFVLAPARIDSLAFGAALAIAMRDPGLYARLRALVRPVAAVSFVLLCSIVLWRGGLSKNDAIVGTIGFTLLGALFSAGIFFALTTLPSSRFNRVLSSRCLRFFGRYSYALYVFHQPVALVLTALGLPAALARLGASEFGADMLYAAAASTLSLTVSLLSWKVYEKRFLKLKDRIAPRSDPPSPLALPGYPGGANAPG
jgi:peptidoglycan/LPS O-acetylase OafA/YrhL